MKQNTDERCELCQSSFEFQHLCKLRSLQPSLLQRMLDDHPEMDKEGSVCLDDLNRYRTIFLREIIQTARGVLNETEEKALKSIREGEIVSQNPEDTYVAKLTSGQIMADRIAQFGGSWFFIGIFALVLLSWIILNTIILSNRAYDPYPFILLNLILSCLAAIQAPVIMMSQNRQESKDRMRSQNDYLINLKAEMEVRVLNQKLDYLTLEWVQSLEILELQTEMLEEIQNQLQEAVCRN